MGGRAVPGQVGRGAGEGQQPTEGTQVLAGGAHWLQLVEVGGAFVPGHMPEEQPN